MRDGIDALDQLLVRPAAGYDLTTRSSVWIGYGYTPGFPVSDGVLSENRAWHSTASVGLVAHTTSCQAPSTSRFEPVTAQEHTEMRYVSVGLLLFVVTGCAQPAPPPASEAQQAVPAAPVATLSMTKERQAAVTPDSALAMLKEGNARFVSGAMLERDLTQQVKATGEAQYPYASVLTCIDSRSGPELVFDQGIGDVFAPRVAGNVVNEDILGSLEYASRVAGSRLVVVLGLSHPLISDRAHAHRPIARARIHRIAARAARGVPASWPGSPHSSDSLGGRASGCGSSPCWL